MDCIFRKNAENSVIIDFATDTGAAEGYAADERKMAVFSPQKAISVLWYWEIKSVIPVQRRYRLESGE